MLGMLRGDEASLRGRELLIHMCSASVSDNPLAAAACLKSAPLQLEHDEVIRACTNATSAEVLSRVTLCSKLLPPDWSYTQAMKLCAWEPTTPEVGSGNDTSAAADSIRKLRDRRQESSSTHTTVQCALEVSRSQVYGEQGKLAYWSKEEVSELCKSENDHGAVRKCALAVKATPAAPSSHNANFLTASAVTTACTEAKDETPGVCLSKLNKMAYQYKVGFAENEGVPEEICTCDDPAYAFSCLEGTMRTHGVISLSDLDSCFSQPRRIEAAQVQRIRSADGAQFPTAGVPFSVTFGLTDQFGSTFESLASGGGNDEEGDSDCGTASVDDIPYQVAINEGNEQGAVLWGIRHNKTACGVLHFSNLIVSQPGEVQIKVVSRAAAHAAANNAPTGSSASPVSVTPILTMFLLHVHPDPNQGSVSTGLCLFPFKEGQTGATELPPADAIKVEEDVEGIEEQSNGKAAFSDAGPMIIRSYLPIQRYLRLLHCAGIFHTWHVSLHAGQGGFWVEYRNGIDAIWTGRGLPRYEDTFEVRLGLPAGLLEDAMTLPTVWPESPMEAARRLLNETAGAEGESITGEKNLEIQPEEEVETNREGEEEGEKEREETEEEKVEREEREKVEEYDRLLVIWHSEVFKLKERECNITQARLEEAGNATLTEEQYRNCTRGIPLNETTAQYDKRMNNIKDWMSRYKIAKIREANREAVVAEHERKISNELNVKKERHRMKKKALIKIERAAQKVLRRAYYAKSLRWHPDRWVGLSYYAEQVRHTFESVTEAYDGLQALITRLSETNSQAVIEEEKLMEGGGGDGKKSTKKEWEEEGEGEANVPIVPAAPATPESNPELFS